MKKVMILGAGNCQVPIIGKAKKMGLKTIVVSRDGDYPGFEIADISLKIDVTDKEKILKKAVEYSIDAILTNQTDISVPSVAYIADKLKLPGIGNEIASRFTNKFKMRQFANICGSKVIKYAKSEFLKYIVKSSKGMTFPLIMKPVDSQGSRGVIKIKNEQELMDNFRKCQSHSLTGEVILEEYFDGKEITIDGLMVDSNFYNMVIGDVSMFPIPDYFIPKSIIYPSELDVNIQKKILELNQKIVKKMELPFGLTHAEYRVNEKTGEVLLIEIAARGGGFYISSDLIPLALQIDPEKILIEQTLGYKSTITFSDLSKASAFFCPELPSGRLKKVIGLDIVEKLPNVHKIICDLKPGQNIEPLVDKTSRHLVFILSGESKNELMKTYQDILNLVEIVLIIDNQDVQYNIV